MFSSKAVLGLPGYQITGIAERAGTVTISARYEGETLCPHCGSGRLRLKDKRWREPRHESWGLRHCVLEAETCKFRCKDCGRTIWQRFPGTADDSAAAQMRVARAAAAQIGTRLAAR